MSEALAKIETEAMPVIKEAQTFIVKDDESFKVAGFRLKDIKNLRTQIGQIFDPQIEAANRSHKISIEQKKKYDGPLEQADKLYRRKRSDYEMDLERKAIFERKRLELEARAKEEKIKREMEEAAIKAEAILGDEEAAKEIREAIPQVVVESAAPAIAPSKAPEVEGFSSAKGYDITVTDPMLLIQAIACGDVVVDLEALITWKVSELKAYLKRSGKKEIPGCLVEEKRVQKVF